MATPLLLPLVCALSGICCAILLGSTAPVWALLGLLLCLLCASLCAGRLPFLLAVAAFSFTWGTISMEQFLDPDPAWVRLAGSEPHLVDATVASRPEGSGGVTRLYLTAVVLSGPGEGAVPMPGRLLLHVRGGRVSLRSGDRVRFSSRIRLPRRYGLPGESDYPRYLALKGVQALAFARDPDEVVLVARGGGWRGELDALSARLATFIEQTVPGEEGGILKALLLGDASGVPPEVQEAYARSGVNHILSISGFHIGIIYLCLFQVLFLVARQSEAVALRLNLKRALLLAALPVTVFYLFLSGCAPATLRSVLMIACLTGALYLRRETDPVNVIMLAACAILAVAPGTAFDISFQLSFIAVWGLAVLAPLLTPRPGTVQGVWRAVVFSISASLAAIIATAVPVAYHFHRVSLAGILCNLLVAPLLGYGAVVSGFASLACSFFFPVPARLLLLCAAQLVRLSDRIIVYCATFPVLEYLPDRLDFFLALLAMALLTFLPMRRVAMGGTVCLCVILVWRGIPQAEAGDGKVHALFLSVGQGDATLLRLPDGKTMLIDGGGSFEEGDVRVGERLLVPALLALKVRRIDYLVLSHPHPDHQQGLLPIAARWDVGEFWESGIPCDSREYQELRWILASRGVPRRVLGAENAPFAAGGAVVEPLWPPRQGEEADTNDASLVLRIRCGRGSFLFTGDVGEDAEAALIAGGARLCCTVLKVGHHGSRRSSSEPFLAACTPQAAVISAGYGNSFRLPAPATLKRLAGHGIRVYRTDLQGSVEAVVAPDGSCQLRTPWEGAF